MRRNILLVLMVLICSSSSQNRKQGKISFSLILPYTFSICQRQCLKPLFLGKTTVFYFNPFLRPILTKEWHLKDVEDHSLKSLSVTTVKIPTQSRRSQLLNLHTQLKTIGITSGMARSRGSTNVIGTLSSSISSSAFFSEDSLPRQVLPCDGKTATCSLYPQRFTSPKL